uniref:uncharacterized protein LOC122599840 n=1 Tax=Erigeron canadensis TaxID=72917 RepID=UPI001CB904E5|nr:uncharacterized protein LOC122599840 [Erigeron canadensis]
MEIGNIEMPISKLRKRRFPTASSSSFANINNLSHYLVENNTDSPRNEKCQEEEKESTTLALQKVLEKTTTYVDGSCEVKNPQYRIPGSFMEKGTSFGVMPLTYDAKTFEGKSRPCGEIEPAATKNRQDSMLRSTNGLHEIKHSLMVAKELLNLLTHVWTVDTNHDHNHPTNISLASTLSHELKKARAYVNKLIQEQKSNDNTTCECKEQDKVRIAVKTIAQELENERKLRRQTERMNKKLGRELANTKSSLDKAVKKAESEKQTTEILEQLCEKMALSIEEDRVELEELKKESERVRQEMEEEREMLRVADMLREERVQMKLIDAKHEYEEKHKQMNILVHDLEELLEADSVEHLKRMPEVLSWYQSTKNDKGGDEKTTMEEAIRSLWYENIDNENDKLVNDELVLVIDGLTNTQNEVARRNSDCIEWEFGLDMKNESDDLNECPEETVLGLSCPSTTKEYEDEMERYKMIKDLRDRIVSGSDLSRDTLDFGCHT